MAYFVIYGDSVAAGYGAPPGRGFVAEMARFIGMRMPKEEALNISGPGWTTLNVTEAIQFTYPELTKAKFIGIYVGGDDIIQAAPQLASGNRQSTSRFLEVELKRYSAMLALLRKHFRGPIIVGTLYNPYPNTALANEAISAYNSRVILSAASVTGVRAAPVGEAFAGNQPALIEGFSDGILLHPGRNGNPFPIHPNARGHRVIAEAFLGVLG